MSERTHIMNIEELGHREHKIVEMDGYSIGIINYDGEYHAVLNNCPHQGGPVCTGLVRGKLVADWEGPGESTEKYVDTDQPTVSCPLHGWEFDLETGNHVGDPDVSVKKFDTIIEDGELYIDP